MNESLGPAAGPAAVSATAVGTPAPEGRARRGIRKSRIGRVISDKMQKTVVVEVSRRGRHPVYKKIVRHSARYKAHDERGEAHVGDTVLIAETRPISKDKRWRVVRVVEKAR
jgi:small subunit ribosomal protein S17